ncbi:hypothetical protein ACFW17_03965 [Streptomyces sp. NPDC058961]|uniref:hypothetical protein n=1 Tax=Streptomyces sp. NPDC058961 TaxID=3346680 RepID=UPI001DCA50F7|nr:hypothetical protein [Streptomyces sp. MAG02]
MSIRSTARFLRYKVTSHPDGGLRVYASCLSCSWVVLPTADHERVSGAMRHHAATKGHALFNRTTEDMAVVVLADKCEQERRAEANALEYQHLGGAAEDARAEV